MIDLLDRDSKWISEQMAQACNVIAGGATASTKIQSAQRLTLER